MNNIFLLGKSQVRLHPQCYIAPTAILIGSVIVERAASVWFNAVIRGDNEPITIGEGTNIQDGAIVHTDAGLPVNIGKGVVVGHGAILHGCTVGDNTLIGIGAVVLNKASIGQHCMIGSNALVTEGKAIPDRSVVVGSPAKVVRQVSERDMDIIYKLADDYQKRGQRYQKELERVRP